MGLRGNCSPDCPQTIEQTHTVAEEIAGRSLVNSDKEKAILDPMFIRRLSKSRGQYLHVLIT